MNLTAERIHEALAYDARSGVFTWKIQTGRCRIGDVAGWHNKSTGYWEIQLDEQRTGAHRVAWFYTHGEWPDDQVDHEDQDKLNNRIGNLRLATGAQNGQNQSRPLQRSKSGRRGVSYDKSRRKWAAYISQGRRTKNLGRFDDIEQATEAYLAAKAVLHPFWAGK